MVLNTLAGISYEIVQIMLTLDTWHLGRVNCVWSVLMTLQRSRYRYGPHLIPGAGLQVRQQTCTCLPPNPGQTTHLRDSTSLFYISGSAGTTITESKQRSLREVATLLFGTSGGTNSRPATEQQSHSPSSTKDSRITGSDFTSALQSMTPSYPPTHK